MADKKAHKGTEFSCREVAEALDAAAGGPLLGIQDGKGPHITLDPNWDKFSAPPIGWRSHQACVKKNKSSTEYSIELESTVPPGEDTNPKLTQAQKKILKDARKAAKALPDDWALSAKAKPKLEILGQMWEGIAKTSSKKTKKKPKKKAAQQKAD